MERYYLDERNGQYLVMDRRGGMPGGSVNESSTAVASRDPEIAARIVRLLNADVARTEKQGAVAP